MSELNKALTDMLQAMTQMMQQQTQLLDKLATQTSLSKLTPTQLGESGDVHAIPILHNYLRNGGIQDRTHAASAIRKLSSSFKAECGVTISSLMKCAADGAHRQNAQLRQYSLLALERLDVSISLESWLRQRLEYETIDYVQEIIYRLLAVVEKNKIAESAPERISHLNAALYRYSLVSFWHITHIENLWSICRYGILSHDDAHAKRPKLHDISDPSVQRWRARRDPIYHRPIHNYAPLYINPKNPMLYKRKNLNRELCLVEVCPTALLTSQYLLANGNAASKSTSFYHDYKHLDQLPWDVLHGEYWNNKPDDKRKMCAEVLVFPRVWPVYIKALHLYDLGSCDAELASIFPIIHSPSLFFD
jgi:hypothetical protein